MYEFKDTKGKEQSAIDKYFDTPDNSLSISEVAEYINGAPTGEYVREPIAYAFKQVAMKLGHKEPVLFNRLSFKPIKVPFITNYIYDNTLPLTMEEVRQEGIDLRYVGGFEVTMYGKVAVGEKIEISRDITQTGADEIIAIGTKPWVNVLKPSYVNKNYATTILVGDVPKVPQTITNLDIPLELQQTANGAGFEIKDAPLTLGEKYTISFEYQPTQGGINDILSYGLGYQGTNIYIDDELIAEYGYLPNNKWAVGGGKHTYYMHFTKDDTGNTFSWKFNYETFKQPTKVWITNLKIHKGHVHPFREDIDLLPIKGTVWQTKTRTETIQFQTTIVEKPDLFPSQSKIAVAGKNGSRTYTWTVEVVDGIETGRTTPEVETEYFEPVTQIYWKGTKEGEERSSVALKFTADDIVTPTPITNSKVTINLAEFGESFPNTEAISNFDNARVVNLSDYGGVGDGATDNFSAFKNVIDDSVNEPLVLQIDDGEYFVEGAENSRLEPWPNKSKGLRIEGTGNNVNIYHKNNRTINRHEYYFMQLVMTSDSLGFEAENITLNGIRNPQEELFYTQSESNPITNIPMARGISVDGAHHVIFNNVRFKNMYGGYAIQLQEYRDVFITNTTYDKVGGNDQQESFGMAIYLGGHAGDAVVNIDNAQAQGMVTDKDLKLSWIGVVLENGTIQSKESSAWLRDKNTTVRITNSSFLDYHSTFHTESMAGNVYWNVDNVTARGSNYNIVAGVYGEYKEVSNRVTMDVLPYGRLWGIVKGLYYSEPQEAEDNWNGHNKNEMYNSVINFIKVSGFEDPPQAVAYGNNVTGRLHNTELNNVPDRLVTNGSALLYNSEVNLAQGNSATRTTLMSGAFSDPSKQRVEFTDTGVNPYGSHKNVTFGTKPEEAKNTGFEAPYIELPITAPI